MTEDDNDLALLVGLNAPDTDESDFETMLLNRMDKGLHFKWDTPPQVSFSFSSNFGARSDQPGWHGRSKMWLNFSHIDSSAMPGQIN